MDELVEIFESHLRGAPASAEEVDSLVMRCKLHAPDIGPQALYGLAGVEQMAKGNYVDSKRQLMKLMRITPVENSDYEELDFFVNKMLAATQLYTGHTDSALYFFHRARLITTDSLADTRLAALANIGAVHQSLGNDSAAYYVIEAGKIAEFLKDTARMASLSLNLCVLSCSQGLPNALTTCHQVKDLILDKTDDHQKLIFFNTLGMYHEDSHNSDSALYYFTEGQQYPGRGGSLVLGLLGMAQAHKSLGNLRQAMQILDTTEQYLPVDQMPYEAITFYSVKAEVLRALKRYEDATESIVKAINLQNKFEDSPRQVYQSYRILGDLLSARAQPMDTASFHAFISTIDTLLAHTSRSREFELLTQYETEKKEQALQNLQQRQKIQALQLRNNKYLIGGLGSILFLSVVGGFVLYRQRASIKQTNMNLRKVRNQLLGTNEQLDYLNAKLSSKNEELNTINTELNHRTSNQISLAYELILDQRRQIGDEQAKASLERSESQLMALREVNRALAHRSDDLVRADKVLAKVAENLQVASPHPFKLDLQLQAVTVHGNAASRSALILSELLSNSIKYGFPNTPSPQASISLSQSERETSITYFDNGPGADGNVRGTGVGSDLIEAMLEDLDAEWEMLTHEDGSGYGMRWWWNGGHSS